MADTGNDGRRTWQRRLSRRRALGWLAVAGTGMAGAALAGCGGSGGGQRSGQPTRAPGGQPTGQPAATTRGAGAGGTPGPKRGGTIKSGEPQGLDQYDVMAAAVTNATYIVRSQYNNLIKYNPKDLNILVADLAKRWEFADDHTLVFQLNQAKFHDGSPVTADDVRFSIERVMDPPKGFFSQNQAAFKDVIDSIESPDPQTVRFKLKRPSASLVILLAQGGDSGWIYPKAAVDRYGPDVFKTRVIGSGPFKFKRHEPGVVYEVERNQDYFKPGLPYADSVQYLILEDAVARRESMLSGQINLIPVRPGITVDDLTAFKSNPAIQVSTSPGWAPMQVVFNTRRPPWNNDRIRRAVALLLDAKAALATIDSGHGFPGGLVPAGSKWALERGAVEAKPGFHSPTDKDRTEAKALFDAAGLQPSDIRVNMIVKKAGLFEPTAVFVQDQFRKMGINADIQVLPVPAHTAKLQSHDYEVLPMHWVVPSDDPDHCLVANFDSKSPANFSGIAKPEIDALLKKQSETLSEAERKRVANQAEAAIIDDNSTIAFFWIERRIATRSNVHDFVAVPGGSHNISHEEVWLS